MNYPLPDYFLMIGGIIFLFLFAYGIWRLGKVA